MKKVLAVAVLFLSSSILYGDIAVTDRTSTLRFLSDPSALRPGAESANPADKAARQAANQAKKDAKKAKHHGLTPVTSSTPDRSSLRAANKAKHDAKMARHAHHGLTPVTQSLHPRAQATGSIALIDAAGLKYFINTNITFSTSSSASGAASEASYQGPIVASTSAGGTVMSSPSDMFDGYGAICVSLTNATGPCATGNASYTMYVQNGPAAFDATVPAGPACTNRQVQYPAKTIGGLSVTRKVFVPTNDRFIRWMNFFTNTTGSPITFTTISSNNLGSDSNTRIVTTSSGDNVATTADTWVTSFQNYSGNTSTDPRIGHVLWGPGAATPISNINFVDGDDNPFWAYSITLAPGQTKAILNFATGQGTKAAANAQAAALDLLPPNATQCLSATELGQIVNFATATDLSIVKNTAASVAFGSNPISYTLAVTNNGPSVANTVSVSDTLPPGSTFVSASGSGWVCNNVAGVVTCTVASLPLGAAPVINLTFNAPPVASAGTLSNTATVSSATSDPTPANNSSTKTVPIFPGNQIPALSTWMLGLLAAALGFVALARRT
ncbi:MAG TPA: IPTL-CTERM sorting domain-containing protein [Thermoanaerobaculia bacterium]